MKEKKNLSPRCMKQLNIRRCKCILTAMLMLVMTFTFLPFRTLKANAITSYWLYILGKQVTSENANDILGDGVFSYDAEKNILTISGDCTRPSNVQKPVIYNEISGLTIYTAKDSTLKTDGSWPCINLEADTIITGPGKFNIVGKIRSIAVHSSKLTIKNANLDIVSTDTDRGAAAIGGIDTDELISDGFSSLEIINSNVKAKNEKNKQLSAISGFRKELTIDGCRILDGSKTERTYLKIGNTAIVDSEGNKVLDIILERYYDLEILGVEVNDSNKADILGNGVFSYNEKNNTLTIDGNFQTASNNSVILNGIYNLTVTTVSDSIISCVNAWFMDNKNDITITTNGKLSVLAGEIGIGSWASSVTIKDADLNIDSESIGIASYNKKESELNIFNSDVSIKSNKMEAIDFFSSITLNDCKITTPEQAEIVDIQRKKCIHDSQGSAAKKVVINKSKEHEVTTTITSAQTTTSTTTTMTEVLTVSIWGDANCDGIVDLADCVLIMQSIANPNTYGLGGSSPNAITALGMLQADVDKSVVGVTGNDALKIQKYLLRLINSLEPDE